jgi:hypothetical protein
VRHKVLSELNCLTLKTGALRSFETPVTTYHSTRRKAVEDLKLHMPNPHCGLYYDNIFSDNKASTTDT